MENSNALLSNSANNVKKYKEINENEVLEENVPDFYKNDITYPNNTLNVNNENNLDELKSSELQPEADNTEMNMQNLQATTQNFDQVNNEENYKKTMQQEFKNQDQIQNTNLEEIHTNNQYQDNDVQKQYHSESDIDQVKQKEQEIKIDNELYIQDNYIYNDGNIKLYNDQLDRKIKDAYTSQIDNNSDHQMNSSDYEQETNDFNDTNNIDDHNSTLFSEEIPINQE